MSLDSSLRNKETKQASHKREKPVCNQFVEYTYNNLCFFEPICFKRSIQENGEIEFLITPPVMTIFRLVEAPYLLKHGFTGKVLGYLLISFHKKESFLLFLAPIL